MGQDRQGTKEEKESKEESSGLLASRALRLGDIERMTSSWGAVCFSVMQTIPHRTYFSTGTFRECSLVKNRKPHGILALIGLVAFSSRLVAKRSHVLYKK